MVRTIYQETRMWDADKSIDITLAAIQGPNGYAVHISTNNEKPLSQHLSIGQADIMFKELSKTLWGEERKIKW